MSRGGRRTPSVEIDPKRSSTRPKSRVAARLDPRQCGMLLRSPWLGPRMQFDQLRRRAFFTLLGGAVPALWPLFTHAQQPALPVVGFLHLAMAGSFVQFLAAFRQGLN